MVREEAALETCQGRASRSGQLVLSRLTKRYPNQIAVDALDLEVKAGEFLTLLGPSGSGKTTTLMMVAGFTSPSDGDIRLNGRSIAGLAPERRNVNTVFQDYALFPHMTVAGNIAYGLEAHGVPRPEIAVRVREALRMVRLESYGERRPTQLSGGQRQRVGLARAIVNRPAVLLLDEPLGALDKNLREQMKFELKRIHAQLGVTVLYVTHDQEEALTMSDRVALMNDGVIAQLGTARDLYERARHTVRAEFIGESNDRGHNGTAAIFVSARELRHGNRQANVAAGERAMLVVTRSSHDPTEPDDLRFRGQ